MEIECLGRYVKTGGATSFPMTRNDEVTSYVTIELNDVMIQTKLNVLF